MQKELMIVRTLTGLHVGCGQATGPVDLPIHRETATSWPVVPGSSVKGVLRDAFREGEAMTEAERQLFGTSPTGKGDDAAASGQLCTSDLFCLLFPVPSWSGCFAWVTCPLALRRLGDELPDLDWSRLEAGEDEALVSTQSKLKFGTGQVLFGEIDLKAKDVDIQKLSATLAQLAGYTGSEVERRLAIVSDTVFTHLTQLCTAKVTKVTLQPDTKTAKEKGLRSEESVPPDAVFWGVLAFQTIGNWKAENGLKMFEEKFQKTARLQFGGKTTTGHGFCKALFHGAGEP